jgi:hypothetical protein
MKKNDLNSYSKQSIQRRIWQKVHQPGPGDLIDQWFDRQVQNGMSYLQAAIYDFAVFVRGLWVSNRASAERKTKPQNKTKSN